jgi:hypothetical protein
MLAASACAPHRAIRRPPWDAHVGDGPLVVRGASPGSPGPAIYHALAADPDAAGAVVDEAEPDTLRVVCRPGGGTRIVLTYRARPGVPARQVVADPGLGGGVCGAARSVQVAVPARRRGEDKRVSVDVMPTALQRLECPIDPTRADCQSFCATGDGYEWCR